MHEIVKALAVRRGEPEIFVEIETDDAGKIERLFAMQAHEFFVKREHRAAGRKTKANLRITANGICGDARAFVAELFFVGFENEEHGRNYARNRLNRFKRIIPAVLQVFGPRGRSLSQSRLLYERPRIFSFAQKDFWPRNTLLGLHFRVNVVL